jgi:hypothetical protein
LSSDILGTGNALSRFHDADDAKNTLIDLDLKGLPSSAKEEEIKKLA